MKIKWNCRFCGTRLWAAGRLAGRRTKCTQCGRQQRIPGNSRPAQNPVPAQNPMQTAAGREWGPGPVGQGPGAAGQPTSRTLAFCSTRRRQMILAAGVAALVLITTASVIARSVNEAAKEAAQRVAKERDQQRVEEERIRQEQALAEKTQAEQRERAALEEKLRQDRERERAAALARQAQERRRAEEETARQERERFLAAERARQEQREAEQRETSLWHSAQTRGAGAIREYLQRHPNGKHSQEARERLDSFLWNETVRLNTIASYEHYLKTAAMAASANKPRQPCASSANKRSCRAWPRPGKGAASRPPHRIARGREAIALSS